MRKSRQSAMGSVLTNRRIGLYFHSAIARMSEGVAVANVALRSEFNKKERFVGMDKEELWNSICHMRCQ